MKRYFMTVNVILPVEANDKKEANNKAFEMFASLRGARPSVVGCEESKIK